jgi:hypothetical protein
MRRCSWLGEAVVDVTKCCYQQQNEMIVKSNYRGSAPAEIEPRR